MNLVPQGKWLVGRVVDIDSTAGGLTLPQEQIKNVTVFLLVDAVGPEVQKAKVGDVILYKAMNHVFLRDGTHQGVVLDDSDNIIAIVCGLDTARITVAGKKVDGLPASMPSS